MDQLTSNRSFEGHTISEGEIWKLAGYKKCSFRSARLIELATDHCEFLDCDFTGARLGGSIHRSTSFLNCNFTDADLYGALFENCRMVGSSFAGSNVSDLKVKGGDWSFVQMRMQELDRVDFSGVKLANADFYAASLEKACFHSCVLVDANLANAKMRGADLRGADLSGVNLKDVDLKGARMNIEQAILFAACHGIVIE